MHVCIVYDCLFPFTIGGAERWYLQLAKAYAAAGYQVTYLTSRQWENTELPQISGVNVICVSPRMNLYNADRRRILPPIIYGIGIFLHILKKGGSYDLIHGASFPFFSLLAIGILRPFYKFRIVVDWHEVWSREYWSQYLGNLSWLGWKIQKACAKIPQVAFSFSRLHAARAQELGVRRPMILEGEYDGPMLEFVPAEEPPTVLYVGRMIPEKRVPLLVEALAILMSSDQSLKAEFIGRGPDLEKVRRQIDEHGLSDRIILSGFVDEFYLANRQSKTAVVVQPSSREGYGMVVVESSARGVPIVVVAARDNASTELVDEGRNGFIAPTEDATALSLAIRKALDGGEELRRSTAEWYRHNRERLSFENSFSRILARLASAD